MEACVDLELPGAPRTIPFSRRIGAAPGVVEIVGVNHKSAGALSASFQDKTTAMEQRRRHQHGGTEDAQRVERPQSLSGDSLLLLARRLAMEYGE